LNDFAGWNQADFDSLTYVYDKYTCTMLRKKMNTFINSIYDKLPQKLRDKLPKKGFGITGDWGWFANRKPPVNVAHYGVALFDDGLRVWVNLEGDAAIEHLRDKISKNKQQLFRILGKLKGYELCVMERKQERPRKWESVDVCIIKTNYLDQEGFEYVCNWLNKRRLEHPRIYVAKRYDPSTTVEKGSQIIDEIVEAMKELEDFYDFASG
jgi:hypothetical protein